MAWYQNTTRFGAIVTLRIIDAGGQEDALTMGIESNLKKVTPKIGIYDYFVGGRRTRRRPGRRCRRSRAWS